jgi:hypothetical protein
VWHLAKGERSRRVMAEKRTTPGEMYLAHMARKEMIDSPQTYVLIDCLRQVGDHCPRGEIHQTLFRIGREDSVGLSVCKVHIFATRWRIYQ